MQWPRHVPTAIGEPHCEWSELSIAGVLSPPESRESTCKRRQGEYASVSGRRYFVCAFCGPGDRLFRFLHPHVPRQRPDGFVIEGAARDLQRQLDLPLVVALVPDQMLEHEDWVVVVPIHRSA